MTSIWKPTSVVATIDAQDEYEITISADGNEGTPTEDEIGNLFQDISSEEELETEQPQFNFQALQIEPSSLGEPDSIMHIHIHHWKDAYFPDKFSGVEATTV